MAACPSLPEGPLSVIAGFLRGSKEALASFTLVSKSWCSAGREQVRSLRPNSEITDSQMERLCEVFPFLENLDISMCEELVAPKLESLVHVTELNAAGCTKFTGPPGGFGNLRSLWKLDLAGCKELKDSALEGLGRVPGLLQLELGSCGKLTDAALPNVGGSVIRLGMNRCKFSADALYQLLPALKNLYSLDVSYCTVKDDLAPLIPSLGYGLNWKENYDWWADVNPNDLADDPESLYECQVAQSEIWKWRTEEWDYLESQFPKSTLNLPHPDASHFNMS